MHVANLSGRFVLVDRALAGPSPQFSLAESFPGFGPTGPWLVTVDDFGDPDDVAIGCAVNGEAVQAARTSQLPGDELVSTIEGIGTIRQRFVAEEGTRADHTHR